MELYVLGAGNNLSKKRNNTSFILKAENYYLIDFPWNIFGSLEQYKLDVKTEDLNHVILTHLHPDHVGNLENFIQYKKFVENKKLKIYVPQEMVPQFRERFKFIAHYLNDDFETVFKDLDEFVEIHGIPVGKYVKVNEIEVKFRKNLHIFFTAGIEIKYNGKIFGYSSDTKYDLDLIKKLYQKGKISKIEKELLENMPFDADFIVHEADNGMYPKTHTNIKTLEKKAKEIGKTIYLAHVPDDLESKLPILEEGKIYSF